MSTIYSEDERVALCNFGKILREHRLRCKLTQEKVAELTDTNVTFLSDIERGRRNLSVINIARLAEAYGVTLEDVFKKV